MLSQEDVNKLKSKILLVCLSVIVVFGFSLAGCVQEEPTETPTVAPTETPEKVYEVVVASMRDYTGPMGLVSVPQYKGVDQYLRHMEETDPIPGVRIVQLWEDTGYDAARYLAAYKRFGEQNPVIVMDGSSTARTVMAELNRRDKMPAYSHGTGYLYGFFPKDVAENGPSYTFYNKSISADYFAATAIYFMDRWKAAGYTEKPKAMFITWNVPLGIGPVELGTLWAEEYGFEMLPSQLYSTGTTELVSQLMKAQELGANFICLCSHGGDVAMLLRDSARLGVERGIGPGKMQFGFVHALYDALPLAGEACEGALIGAHASWANYDVPGVKLARELQTRYGQPMEDLSYLLGTEQGITIWTAVKRAAEKYGPANVTKEAIFDILTTSGEIDMMGLCPNVSYGPNDRRPYKVIPMYEIQDGVPVNVGTIDFPWLTPVWEETGLTGWRPSE